MLCRPGVVLGHEFVGRVVAAGDDVAALRVGDRVVSGAGISCGHCRWCLRGRTNLCAEYRTLGLQVDGGLAEYVTSPAAICHPVPDACDDDAAAMTQPLAVALHALSRVALGPGDAVAVIGAGGIGSFIVAGAARRASDGRVVAIDIDDERLATARALGRRRDGERDGPRPRRAAARAHRRRRVRRRDRGQRRPARACRGDRGHAPRRARAARRPARRATADRPHPDDPARGRHLHDGRARLRLRHPGRARAARGERRRGGHRGPDGSRSTRWSRTACARSPSGGRPARSSSTPGR